MIIRRLFQQYRRHLQCFYDDFDSIKDINIEEEFHQNIVTKDQPSSKLKTKLHYLIGMQTILYVGVDSMLIIYQEGFFSSRKWTAITSIEMLFPHRIFPKTFWYQADIIALLCLSMAVTLFAIFSFLPPMPRKGCLFALNDKQTGKMVKLVDASGVGMYLLPIIKTLIKMCLIFLSQNFHLY